MAAITVEAAKVRKVRVAHGDEFTAPTTEAMPAGSYARLNPTTGRIEYGNASSATEVGTGRRGITITAADRAGQTVTVVEEGLISIGDSALDGMDFGDSVFVNDTDGSLGDAAGTTSAIVGTVDPAFGSTTPDRLLFVKRGG